MSNTEREVPAAGDEKDSAGKPKATQSRRNRASGATRPARVAETREAKPVRTELDAPWANPASLQAPKSRPGMVQRWIRVGTRGQPDPTNLARKLREGWVPRKADTVPDDFPVPRIETGRFVGGIGVEGMVLMEMPAARNAQRNEFYRKRNEAITRAIDEDLIRANQDAGGGFGPIARAQRSIPVRERRVPVAGDELNENDLAG